MKKDLLRYWKANSPEPRVDWPKKKKDFVFFAKSGSKKKKEAPVSFERKSDRRQTQQIIKTQVCPINWGEKDAPRCPRLDAQLRDAKWVSRPSACQP